jgi:hypothetical protein
MKECTNCKTKKNYNEFYNRAASKDNLTSQCKLCISSAKSLAYKEDKNNVKEKKRLYSRNFARKNKDKRSKYQKQHYESNKSLYKEKSAKRYLDNKEHIKKQVKKWREDNYQRYKNYSEKWRLENLNLKRLYCATRRAKKLKATPVWSEKELIKQFYKNCPKGMVVDHIIPLQNSEVCGLHVLSNLQYLTRKENNEKYNKLLEEYKC